LPAPSHGRDRPAEKQPIQPLAHRGRWQREFQEQDAPARLDDASVFAKERMQIGDVAEPRQTTDLCLFR
jgi:hypothetical protein